MSAATVLGAEGAIRGGLAGNLATARLMEQLGGGDTAGALETLARLYGAGKDVACYTGWTYEQLLEKNDPAVNALLAEVDLLIDGPFVLEQRNLELRFRGSENQRLIDMNKTRQQGRVVLLEL